MSGLARTAPGVGATVIGVATFVVGWNLMRNATVPAPEQAPAIAVNPSHFAEGTSSEPNAPFDVVRKPDGTKLRCPLVIDAKTGGPVAGNLSPSSGTNASGGGMNGPWEKRSGYGLPNPRGLTAQEKAALNLLGGVADIQGYNFARTTLEDGSTIPGVPPLERGEVRKRLFDTVAAKGMGAWL